MRTIYGRYIEKDVLVSMQSVRRSWLNRNHLFLEHKPDLVRDLSIAIATFATRFFFAVANFNYWYIFAISPTNQNLEVQSDFIAALEIFELKSVDLNCTMHHYMASSDHDRS